MECFMVDCRDMALELANHDVVHLIDAVNGHLWSFETPREREKRLRKPLVDKLRGEKLYFESDDEQFMQEPEKPVITVEDDDDDEDRRTRKRSASKASRHSEINYTHYKRALLQNNSPTFSSHKE